MDQSGLDDPPGEAPAQAAPDIVGADHSHETSHGTQRGHVVRGVARATGSDLRGVVLEDQHRSLARHPIQAPVNELVRDEIADHRDPRLPEGLDQLRQPCAQLGLAGTGVDRRGNHGTNVRCASRALIVRPARQAGLVN